MDQVITQANQTESWRSCDDAGGTFIAAMSEGEGVCPWTDGLPIPEDYSEEGPHPIIVVRTDGGPFRDVVVPRGDAHVIIINEESEVIDRWSPSGHQGQVDSALRQAVRSGAALDLLHNLLCEI